MQRRRFIQQSVLGTAVVAASGLPYWLIRVMSPNVYAAPQTHLRPPGALTDDGEFMEACIGCGLCGEVCPPRCIQFYQHEGGVKINTPYINPEHKACILSEKCMPACPHPSLPIKIVDSSLGTITRHTI